MDADPNTRSKLEPLYTPKRDPNWEIIKFKEFVEKKRKVDFGTTETVDYRRLHGWSCENIEAFWEDVWQFCDVVSSVRYTRVLADEDSNGDKITMDKVPKWFPGARLNYAENLLRKPAPDDYERVALCFAREGMDFDRDAKRVTRAQLRNDVRRYAAALRAVGVVKGDKVVGYMPNCLECTVAMLATASIGAVWSSAAPDFGHHGVVERFSQVRPKVLFSVEAVRYNGKIWPHLDKIQDVVTELPHLETVVIVPFLQDELFIDTSKVDKSMRLNDFLEGGKDASGDYPALAFEQVPFDHPLYIMFSSGTTGVPKCIVHSAGGTLLKHLEEHRLQNNLNANDVILFWTNVGWMMWNWLVSALATDATVVLFDGAPYMENNPYILFKVCESLGVTVLGMGAKLYETYEQKKLNPKDHYNLEKLRLVLSTGSSLKPSSFEYIHKWINPYATIGSIAGGTDIIACFMGTSGLCPVYKGQCQCIYLGMDVKAFNSQGESVSDEAGELVCVRPFPSMPVHFLNDANGDKYHGAYFDKFPGVWAHGDYCVIDSRTGGVTMLGRSDGTLNPGGVRFGSSEIYQVVERLDEVSDSVCVGRRLADGDERVVLFLKLSGCDLNPVLIKSIKTLIRTQLSPKHVPEEIYAVEDIPYTVSGKKVEIAIRQMLGGETVKNRNALRNPEALDLYAQFCDQTPSTNGPESSDLLNGHHASVNGAENGVPKVDAV